MGNHMSLRVTQRFKISLKLLIAPHRIRRVPEKGVDSK